MTAEELRLKHIQDTARFCRRIITTDNKAYAETFNKNAEEAGYAFRLPEEQAPTAKLEVLLEMMNNIIKTTEANY